METIFALATAEGKAGVAVIRVSGPLAREAAQILCRHVPEPRRAALRRITDHDGTKIDDALVLAFERGASFTGEDVFELHLHGSVAVVQAVLRALGQIDGLRLAEPGEFTRQAFLNGRMDLVQVEALGDLIEAETELQRKQALDIHGGRFGERIADWRRDLIQAAALLEATIDFADEEVPVDVSDDVRVLLRRTRESLADEISGSFFAERVRTGFEVAIVGAPNVGKSSLLNALAGREAAITSEIAGTTRDVIEVRMDLEGLPITFLDTAGIRETSDEIEAIGVQRALDRAERADLRVVLVDAGSSPMMSMSEGDIVRATKADLTEDPSGVSAKTGYGVPDLIGEVKSRLVETGSRGGLASRERHRFAMEKGIRALDTALEMLETGSDGYDMTAEEVRGAHRALGALIGLVDVDDVLDDVFSRFCLGK